MRLSFDMEQPDIKKSTKIEMPEGQNTAMMLKSSVVRFVLQCCQMILNLKVLIRQTDGTNILPPVYATTKYSPDGITVIIDPVTIVPGQGSGSSTGNWNYRGLWVGGTSYGVFDVVQFGTGTSAGMYLSTLANNGNEPDIGPGWVQISSSSGAWI